MEAINKQTLKQRARSYLRSPLSLLLLALVTVSALITVSALVFLIVYILVNGIPYLIVVVLLMMVRHSLPDS